MARMKNPRSILITGASSGLGAALARRYANEGVTLFLQGRDAQRLERTAAACREYGATVHCQQVDVTDAKAMQTRIEEADRILPLELVIANAGISAGLGDGGEPADQARKVFSVNIDGVMNTLQPVIPAMVARKTGQLVIISSLAGIRGLPSCPAYAASKACVRSYGEGLRGWLAGHGVAVNVVCPGFITTPLTQVNDFPMPLIMSAEKAARIIARGLAKNRARIGLPAGAICAAAHRNQPAALAGGPDFLAPARQTFGT